MESNQLQSMIKNGFTIQMPFSYKLIHQTTPIVLKCHMMLDINPKYQGDRNEYFKIECATFDFMDKHPYETVNSKVMGFDALYEKFKLISTTENMYFKYLFYQKNNPQFSHYKWASEVYNKSNDEIKLAYDELEAIVSSYFDQNYDSSH